MYILDDCQRLISTYHDPDPFSMLRIGIAPCTPFTVTKDLMRESAMLARSHEEREIAHACGRDDG